MSITFPTLDLGDLGASVDDAIRSDPAIAAVDAAAADAAPVATGESATIPEAAADAGPEATVESQDGPDEAYRARFEAEYAERSRKDIAAIRSPLDRRITALQKEVGRASGNLQEAENYATFLEEKLAEYDPDEVARFRRNRTGYREQREREARTAELEFQNRLAFRDREFRRLYPGLDPDDPELMDAFRAGDQKLEMALIRERLALAKAAPPPAAKATPAAPKAPAERDQQGRFVARAEATRQAEQARGVETAGRLGGGPSAKPASNFEEARLIMQAGFDRLRVPR